MKKVLLGILIGLLLFPAICDIINTYDFMYKNSLPRKLVYLTLAPTYGIGYSISGRCTDDVGINGHGWEFIMREYYGCNEIQIMISDALYGKHTKSIRNKKPEELLCKFCKFRDF